MAKAKGPLFSIDASGTISNAMYYNSWKGLKKVNKYIVPRDRKSSEQLQLRSFMADGIIAWRELSGTQKDYYENIVKSKGLRMSGYNYFLSEYINDRIAKIIKCTTRGLVYFFRLDESFLQYGYPEVGTQPVERFGFSFVDGPERYHISFNGTSDYGKVPHDSSMEFANEITIEFWAKIKTPGLTGTLFDKEGGSGNRGWKILQVETGGIDYIQFSLYNTDQTLKFNLRTDEWNFNEWTHFVARFDSAGRGQWFVNKIPQEFIDTSPGFHSSTQNWYWGASNGTGYFYDGALDNMRIYNVALTQEEINLNFST